MSFFAPTDLATGDSFGSGIAVDGSYTAVGAPQQDSSKGAVYILKRDQATGTWSQTAKVVASDAGSNDQFGMAVALFDKVLVVGAPFKALAPSSMVGRVYIFQRNIPNSETWTLTQIITPVVSTTQLRFGASLGYDGKYLAVGAAGDIGVTGGVQRGAVYGYKYDFEAAQFILDEKITQTIGSAGSNAFGAAVSLRNFTLAVGAPLDKSNFDFGGSLHIVWKDASDASSHWTFQQTAVPAALEAYGSYGARMYLDDSRLFAGAPVHGSSDAGAVWSFDLNDTDKTWYESGFFYNASKEYHYSGEVMVAQGNFLAFGVAKDGGYFGTTYPYMYNTTGKVWQSSLRKAQWPVTMLECRRFVL